MPETDPVQTLLEKAPMSKAQKAELWDAFQSAADADDLATKIKPLGVPTHIKAGLWDLKASSTPDAPAVAIAEPKPAIAENPRTWGDTAVDVAKGAAKGVGNTVFGLGKVVHDYTPIGRISDAIQPGAFDQRPPELEPSNIAQRVGFTGEQIAEYFIPASTATKVGKAVNVAKDAALSLAQSGSPVQAGVTGAISAAIPGGSAAAKASSALKQGALDTMAGSLKATKEWAKLESERLAPEMLKRGIGGSIPKLRTVARETAARVGKNLAQAYDAATAAGDTVSGLIVRGNVQLAKDALHTRGTSGKLIPVPGYQTAIKALDDLDAFVAKLPDDIPVNQAAGLKRAFDDIAEQAGLFGPNKMASASEKKEAWAFKKASDSIRELLNTNPTIEELNKEASFWIGLRNVVDATKLRKTGQVGGLIPQLAGAGGAAAGATVAGPYGMIGGAYVANRLARVLQSPAYMNKVSAPLKNTLADALASGSVGRIADATARITASLPAQVRAQ
jgi:hypothetical protein